MRKIKPVVEALCAAIPDSDENKRTFVHIVRKALSDMAFVAPEATYIVWLKVREALLRFYAAPHALAPVLSDIFCNTVSSKAWRLTPPVVPSR